MHPLTGSIKVSLKTFRSVCRVAARMCAVITEIQCCEKQDRKQENHTVAV